jgi:putative glutamine amidotransferase
MPLIGITASRKIEDYRQAILHSVGDVRIIDHTMTVDAALAGLDGLMLTGGDDVTPSRYGEPPHATVVEVEPERDEFEIALIKEARALNLPILAICRGIQVMNVAFGGTLIQDIPSQINSGVEHKLAVPPHSSVAMAHEIWFEKDSLLGQLLGERLGDLDSCEVNSRHHQAVKQVAAGFKVSATAPDGVIEAIEDPTARFCLGVQWHPENFFRTGEFRALFEGFVEEAKKNIKR